MYNFNVEKIGDELIISTNTFWYCNVYGNFRLSKYSGEGNDKITISVPEELPYSNGSVIFSYGDERCEYPSIDIFMINDCYIRTEPMFNVCQTSTGEKQNILKLMFKEENESISVKIYSNGIWYIPIGGNPNKIDCFANGDELLISAKEGDIDILPNIDCGDDKKVIIRLKKTKKTE